VDVCCVGVVAMTMLKIIHISGTPKEKKNSKKERRRRKKE
jgi:hypothetical protein